MNKRMNSNFSSLYMKYADHLSKMRRIVVGEKKGQDVFDIELVDPAFRQPLPRNTAKLIKNSPEATDQPLQQSPGWQLH